MTLVSNCERCSYRDKCKSYQESHSHQLPRVTPPVVDDTKLQEEKHG